MLRCLIIADSLLYIFAGVLLKKLLGLEFLLFSKEGINCGVVVYCNEEGKEKTLLADASGIHH